MLAKLAGMRPTRSTAKRIRAGITIGAGRMKREVAVWRTARRAAERLVTTGCSELLGSKMLMPYFSSVERMKKALMKPAEAVATYAVKALKTKREPPIMVLVHLETSCLVKRATLMLVIQASK